MKNLLFVLSASLLIFTSCGDSNDETASNFLGDGQSPIVSDSNSTANTIGTPETGQFRLGEASYIASGVPDVKQSTAFYEKLGFKVIQQNNNPFPWVYMSDGSVMIGLFQDGQRYLGMTYFTNHFDRKVQQMKAAGGIVSNETNAGAHKMTVFLTPDSSVSIAVVGAIPPNLYQPDGPTFADVAATQDFMNPAAYPNPKVGVFSEFAVATDGLEASMAFWKMIGYTVMAHEGIGTEEEYAILMDDFHIVGVHQTKEWDDNAITYFMPDATDAIKNLEGVGLVSDELPEEWGNKHATYTSPGGHKFNVFSLQ